jgi:CBS domain-containing protein
MDKPDSVKGDRGARPGSGVNDDGILPVNPVREIVTCGAGASIHAAAALMAERNVGSIVVVDEKRRPLGIVTDTDLRNKVVAGGLPADGLVRSIMSTPVITVPVRSTASGTIITMMRRGIRHLCITEDGTPDSAVIGIISEHDVVLLHGNNPAVLAKEIAQAEDVAGLAVLRERGDELVSQYVSRGISVRFVADMIAEINDALVARLIAIAERMLRSEGLSPPAAGFCWLSLGSDGRREQLIQTDQDTALVYGDPGETDREATQAYYGRLASEITAGLTACGFAPCPGNNMASNPEWCRPVARWEEYFRTWIRVPNGDALLNAATFFDFRPVHGDFSLAHRLRECITAELASDRTALILLAKNAAHNPPATGLWERLNVEKKGAHRGLFDLKLRAMKPVTEAVRVLALDRGIHSVTGTLDRIEQMAADDRSIASISRDVVEAYELFMRYRVVYGTRGEEAGRYLDPRRMSKQEMRRLRYLFGPVSSLLKLVQVRYQLDALGLR